MILKVWLPIALRYEVDYGTFWNINPRIINIYQEEYRRRIEEQQRLMDYEAWLRGQYQMASIGAALSKKCKYPKQPFSMQEKEKGLSEEEQFLLWVDEFNQKFDDSEK